MTTGNINVECSAGILKVWSFGLPDFVSER